MIGLKTDADARLGITYNGFTLNDPDDDDHDVVEVSEVIPQQTYESVTDPRQGKDGLEAADARKIAYLLVVRGVIRAPSLQRLYDRIEEMAVAFDPALASLNNPSVNGFLPLDFSIPTVDDTWTDNLIPSRYYTRTLRPIAPPDSRFTGTNTLYEMTLLCRDPRRYLQTTETQAGAGTAENPRADYISYPTITITMSGAGSATYQLANTTVGGTLWLNLSALIAADVVVVDMDTQLVTINGTASNGIVLAATTFWHMKPGNNTLTITNGTNATTSTEWRPAFVL